MTFSTEIRRIGAMLRDQGQTVHTEKWQGVDISSKPEMATRELQHVFMNVPVLTEDLTYLKRQIAPNLPWADQHFEERVCGQPINPGVTWKSWPYGHSASKFLDGNGRFNHNYMERYWPKFAGWLGSATETAQEFIERKGMSGDDSDPGHFGIYHRYGDLMDVVRQVAREPLTRQAILPVFFPEDTGAVHEGRVPCSIAYQFFIRNGKMDVVYWLRSCDFMRHFRDDIYLTIRLMLWVLQEARKINPALEQVVPGNYVMMITSLHLFINDVRTVFGDVKVVK